MGLIKMEVKGDHGETERYLKNAKNLKIDNILNQYGMMGVNALRNATPKDSGLTANSWHFTIEHKENVSELIWANSNVSRGWAKVAILIQYGHGTRNGGYVQGIDYINPALAPVFNSIAEHLSREVKNL